MSQTMRQDGEMHYEIREVVGLFPNAGALETAVEQLGIVGFDRAAISVLAAAAQRNGQNAWQQTATAIADDPSVPRAAFVSHVSRVELRAICVAGPALFGGFAAAWAAVAYGGDMSWQIISTAIATAAGAGLGLLLLRVAVRRRSADVQRQLAAGGLALWVSTPDDASEQSALAVLQSCAATAVHAHRVPGSWGVKDVPLHNVQPDPLLQNVEV